MDSKSTRQGNMSQCLSVVARLLLMHSKVEGRCGLGVGC